MNYMDAIDFITPYAKSMMKKKEGYYLLLDNTLISLNEEQSQLAVVTLPQNTDTIICQVKENIGDQNNPIDYRYYYMMHNMYTNYIQLSYNDPIISIENVQNIEELSNLLKMKMKQGAVLYNWENSIILPFFGGMIPINKSDKMNINIYPFDNVSNIIKYSVQKAKPKCIIDFYMRLMLV